MSEKKKPARPYRLGLVGLEGVGAAMAARLLALGWQVTCWGVDADTFEALREAGGRWGNTPSDVRKASDIVMIVMPDAGAVREVCFGAGGLAKSKGAHIVIDFSTTSVDVTKEIAGSLDVAWLDCPVAGSPDAAERGQLTLMAGGTTDLFEWVEPILRDLSSNLHLMGPLGAGQATKLISQAIVGTNLVLMGEVLAQVRAAGIDGDKLVHCFRGGSADSVVMQRYFPRMLARDFATPNVRAGQVSRDLTILRDFNDGLGLSLPVQDTAINQYRAYAESGNEDADSASVSLIHDTEADGET